MDQQIKCPKCGETEELIGRPTEEGIKIQCESCKHSWLRDAEPQKCASCGGSDIVKRKRALTQTSRGTQLSIVGFTPILLCRQCDQRMLEWANTGHPVPFNYKSAAVDADAIANRDEDDNKDIKITP